MSLPVYLKFLENNDPDFAQAIEKVFTSAMTPRALDQKTKLLIALALDAAHGTITQAQSTAVGSALKSSHHHGHHGGSSSAQSSTTSSSSSAQSSPLDCLVTAGTITQDQANTIISAFQSATQSQSSTASTNPINSTFAAAMQAYGMQ